MSCFPPCNFDTCYVTNCYGWNTVAHETLPSIFRARALGYAAPSLSYVMEYNVGYGWRALKSSDLRRMSSCEVQLFIGNPDETVTTLCGSASEVDVSSIPSGSHAADLAVRVGINQLNMCVAEYHPTLGSYDHIHASPGDADPCQIWVDLTLPMEVVIVEPPRVVSLGVVHLAPRCATAASEPVPLDS